MLLSPLPIELWDCIIHYLSIPDRLQSRLVCSTLRSLSDTVWLGECRRARRVFRHWREYAQARAYRGPPHINHPDRALGLSMEQLASVSTYELPIDKLAWCKVYDRPVSNNLGFIINRASDIVTRIRVVGRSLSSIRVEADMGRVILDRQVVPSESMMDVVVVLPVPLLIMLTVFQCIRIHVNRECRVDTIHVQYGVVWDVETRSQMIELSKAHIVPNCRSNGPSRGLIQCNGEIMLRYYRGIICECMSM